MCFIAPSPLEKKLLIRLIERSAKSYDTVELAKLFPGATPKAIEERIAKLKREAKAMDNPSPSSSAKKRGGQCSAGASASAKKVKNFVTCMPAGTAEDDEESKRGIIEAAAAAAAAAGIKTEMKVEETFGGHGATAVITAMEESWPVKAEVVE